MPPKTGRETLLGVALGGLGASIHFPEGPGANRCGLWVSIKTSITIVVRIAATCVINRSISISSSLSFSIWIEPSTHVFRPWTLWALINGCLRLRGASQCPQLQVPLLTRFSPPLPGNTAPEPCKHLKQWLLGLFESLKRRKLALRHLGLEKLYGSRRSESVMLAYSIQLGPTLQSFLILNVEAAVEHYLACSAIADSVHNIPIASKSPIPSI